MEIHIQRREEALKAYRDSLAIRERLTEEELRTSGLAASLPVAGCAAAGNRSTGARWPLAQTREEHYLAVRKFQCVVMSAPPVQGTQYRLAPRSVTALFLRIDPCYGSSEPTASGL
jgi:hypothetical protein